MTVKSGINKICLICGSGASSAFLAINIRKAAKKKGLLMIVENRPGSALKTAINEFDIILIAPHLEFLIKDIVLSVDDYCQNIKIIPFDIYGTMDGNLVLMMLQD